MTERLADLQARISGIGQLAAVVKAMRGIAAARARQARGQIAAVDSYAASIAQAIGRCLAALPPAQGAAPPAGSHPALVVFGAEQGFAGGFTERVLDGMGRPVPAERLFLVGTRGQMVARQRGLESGWAAAMPSHSQGIPRLADSIAEALFSRIAAGGMDSLEAVFSQWEAGHGVRIRRRQLFPLDPSAFRAPANAMPPLLNLPVARLLADVTADYVHAQLCNAALHAFAAENEARLASMSAAQGQIEKRLDGLQATLRIARQQAITAEIIELAGGEAASRGR